MMIGTVQGRAAGLAVSQRQANLVGAVTPRRTPVAFTSSRSSVKVAASAEPAAPGPPAKAPAPRNSGPRTPRPAPTVDLATVKPGQEFEGTVVSQSCLTSCSRNVWRSDLP